MISLILFSLAAVFNAFMDALENENFGESILKNWNKEFWYKRESWKHAKRIFGYRIDGWHLAKSAMIVTLAFSAVFYKPVINWYCDIILAGIAWNFIFWLVYHKILSVD